jgi:hypothetical protein
MPAVTLLAAREAARRQRRDNTQSLRLIVSLTGSVRPTCRFEIKEDKAQEKSIANAKVFPLLKKT